jgi:CubicO group peptidase (beta-lactamase class C family)
MSEPNFARPEAIGLDPERLQRAHDLLQRWCDSDRVPSAALCVGRKAGIVEPHLFGRQRPEKDTPAVRKDSQFLVASLSKPVTATAVMLLVERGEVDLDDGVATFVPRFAANSKGEVRVRHLMTHTSGLPDMVPNNFKLRMAHRPLSAFIDEICTLPLLFEPGTRVTYQSTGIAMLAEIVHQVSGKTIQEFLRTEVFEPLGMRDTHLGWRPTPRERERYAEVREPAEMAKADWGWNSPYWLEFGAPWGGLITTPADFARFCRMMLQGGTLGDVHLLSPATVRAMTSNQLAWMPQIPEEERRCRPWGLGWRLNWPGEPSSFGDLPGPNAYGHWGATGTVCWIDPDLETFCVLFTTQPQQAEARILSRICNAVAAAVRK